MEHDDIELPARLIHVNATGQAGERSILAQLTTEQRDAMTSEAAAMLSGFGRTSYTTDPEGLITPRDIAAAAKAQIEAWEPGEATTGDTMARGMPLAMALMRSGSERTS